MGRPRKPRRKGDESGSSRAALERLLKIHKELETGTFPNATYLATEMEVSTKTIYRDFDFMRDRLGLPIEYSAMKNGFFYSQKVVGFPVLQMSEGEFFALMVAEKALQQYQGTPFEKPLMTAFQKMVNVLPETISVNLTGWDKTISFKTTAEPIIDFNIFDKVATATAHSKTIKITYKKPGASDKEVRTINPYQLANIDGEWYLYAYDHMREALRTFMPTRIHKVEETGKSFKRPNTFSLEKTLAHSFGVRSGPQKFDVALRFSPEVADFIKEKRWHASQELKELRSGEVELRFEVSDLAEVVRWVVGWGGEAKVLKPAKLAEMVKETARKILKS